MKKKSFKLLLILALTLLYIVIFGIQTLQKNNNIKQYLTTNTEKTVTNTKYRCLVTKVVDGDTIDIRFLNEKPDDCNQTERVRFIGVNTPELNLHKKEPEEYYAKEAYQFTKQELNEEYIEIQFDDISSRRDKYGRIICYIWVSDHLFNRILIERGYGRYYSNFEFNHKYMELFSKAEQYSKSNKLGMWKYE